MSAYSSSPASRKGLPNQGQGEIQRITIRQAPNIHELTKRGIFGDVERMITATASLMSEVDPFGQTPLHIAAYEGYMDIVEYLIQLGASLSVQDKNGWTPLHCASSNRHLTIVEKLIGAGADPNAMNSSGSTALHYLVMMPLSDHLLFVLNLMLKKDAQLGLANEHGITPLHKACQGASDGVVLFLLMSGADPEIPTTHKECAIHVACRLGKQRLVEALILNGASTSTIGPDGNAEETARRNGQDAIAEYIHNLKSADALKRRKKRKEEKKNSGKLASLKTTGSGKLVKSSTSPSVHTSSEDLSQRIQASGATKRTQGSSSTAASPLQDESALSNSGTSTAATPNSNTSSLKPSRSSNNISSKSANTSNHASPAASQAQDLHPAITAIYSHQTQPASGEEDDQSGSMRLQASRRSAKISDLMKIFQSHSQPYDAVSTSDLKKRSLDGSKPGRSESPNPARPSTPPLSRAATTSSPLRTTALPSSDSHSPSNDSHLNPTGISHSPAATERTSATEDVEPSRHHHHHHHRPSPRLPSPSPRDRDRKTSPVPALMLDHRNREGQQPDSEHPTCPVSAHASLDRRHHETSESTPTRALHTSRDVGASPALADTSSGSYPSQSHPFNSLSTASEEDDVVSSISSRASLLSSRSFSTDRLSDSASDTGSDPKIPGGRRVGDPVSFGSPRARDKNVLKSLDRSTSDILGKVKVRSNDARSPTQVKGVNRVASSEFGPRTVQRISKTQKGTRQTKPFSKMLKDINLDALISLPNFPQPANTVVNVSESMVIPSPDFFIEFAKSDAAPTIVTPRTPSAAPSSPRERQLFSDDPEPTACHFKSNFFDEHLVSYAHWNVVAYVEMKFHPAPVPMIISLIQKGHSVHGLLRTISGDVTFSLDVGERKMPTLTAKKLIRLLQEQNDALKSAKLVAIKDPTMSDQLLDYEKTEKNAFRSICSHKIGIVYVKEGQITEEEMLGNKNGSSSFEDFLSCIGTKIELQDWAGFDGGLDTKKDRTGKHSVFTTWQNFEIMFHVSAYIPLGSGEEKYVEKKKHIGNDMTTIIYLDTETTAFKPPTLAGDFLHNFIVIHPRPDGTFGICVATKKGTPEYGPSLPPHSSLPLGDQLREFILSKIINAERATLFAPMFLTKRRQARQHWLSGIINKFLPSK